MTTPKKIAEQLVNKLTENNIIHFYAIAGDSLNYINDSVRRNLRLLWIHVRHEETGAYAASAEAQLSGSIACCAGSSGPGHVHLVNGLYDAHRSNAPVLAIASTQSSTEFGTDYFQATHPEKLFEDCSCYCETVNTPEQFSRILQCGMQHAIGCNDVAVIGIPGNLTTATCGKIFSSENTYQTPTAIIPDKQSLMFLAEQLNHSSRITLFCGIGCRNAHDEVVALAMKLHAPVVYTVRGKMEIEHANPNAIGMTGLLGTPDSHLSLHEADVILMFGTDFPYSQSLPQKAWIAQVDIRPERIGRRAKVSLGLHGDVKHTLQALMPLITPKEDRTFLDRQLKRREIVHQNLRLLAENYGKSNNIAPEAVTQILNRFAPDNAVFTVDTGMCCVWASRYLTSTGRRSMIGSFNHGSMGNALPHAIGAALASPNRPIIALCGDGGLSMCLGELATVREYNLNIKIIVYNNRSLNMVKLEMETAGIPKWQTDMENPDFAKISTAMGIPSLTITEPDQLTYGIEKALNENGAYLVHILTNPEAYKLPVNYKFDDIEGFIQSMYQMLLKEPTMELA